MKNEISFSFRQKIGRFFAEILRSERGRSLRWVFQGFPTSEKKVQKYENLVDLEKPEKNEYSVAIVAVHTAENERLKV